MHYQYIKKLMRLLSRHEKKRLSLVFIGILGLGLLEIAGIGSVLPFLAVAANPGLATGNRYLNFVYQYFQFESVKNFLFALGIGTLLFIVFSNIAKAVVYYMKNRYTTMRLHSISHRLLKHYLSRPYVFYLNHNSAELTKNILSEVNTLIIGTLMPLLDLLTHLFVAGLIILLLITANPVLALMMFLILGVFYGSIYYITRKKLKALGKERMKANTGRYKSVTEAMGGIKDVKVSGREQFFLDEFSRYSLEHSRIQVTGGMIENIPQYMIEIITYGGVLLILMFLIRTMGDFQTAVPIIGLYAFAAQRLKPSMNIIFMDIAQIKTNLPVVDLIYDHLSGWDDKNSALSGTEGVSNEKLPFLKEISLQNISFSYPGSSIPVINDISLSIKKDTTVGFVGSTGCGKTTLVDIILGLLEPHTGKLKADGTIITAANVTSWRRNTGYVPQQIYLTDDTIKRNIAFGVPEDKIDMAWVIKAADIANLHDFIADELPEGYETTVGERGVRLSGGQKQRIGIARALYHDPEIFILDEATSALDSITEAAIMDAIRKISRRKTIIMIAHRLTTVKMCDEIIILDKGAIADRGSYNELVKRNERFKKMAEG